MPAVAPQRLRFGPFEADLKAGELRRRGRRLRLQEKPFEVLEALLQRPGEAVTRQELRDRLWPTEEFGDFDQGLNNAVNKLRLALGDSATEPRFIETVGRGYRFIGAVDEVVSADGTAAVAPTIAEPIPAAAAPVTADAVSTVERSAAPPTRAWARRVAASLGGVLVLLLVMAASSGPRTDRIASWLGLSASSAGVDGLSPIRGLAVLPLQNVAGDESQDYFAYGMTDALITELAKLEPIKVISQTSVMGYRRGARPVAEIAQELGVDAVIDGSVLRDAGRVRISLRLVRAKTNEQLWADSFERPLPELPMLQADMVRAVIAGVQTQVAVVAAGPPPTTTRTADVGAYELYLQGHFHAQRSNPAAYARAVEYYEQALALDPEFALAYTGIAMTRLRQEVWGGERIRSHAEQVKRAVSKALALDPNLAEAHVVLGTALKYYDWDWVGSEAAFKRAIQLKPNLANAHFEYSWLLQELARFDEAVAEAARAVALDPRMADSWALEGRALYRARRLAEAEDRYRRALVLEPGFGVALERLVELYLIQGSFAEARKVFARLEQIPSHRPLSALRAHLEAATGNAAAARRLLAAPGNSSLQTGMKTAAAVFTLLDDRDQAFAVLDRAVETRMMQPIYLSDPELDPLRSDPRFLRLLERTGLPRETVLALVRLPTIARTRAGKSGTPAL